jgi:zinc transport system permease protein
MQGMPGMPWPLPWPFDRTFMQLALVAAVVVGACAPLIGTFLVQKRLALMGDGIGHVAVAGIGAGLLFGTSPLWTALVFGVVAALAIERLRSRGRASGDLALALFFYGGIAAGVVFASRAGAPNLQPYLFGSILTVSARDVWTVVAMGAVIVIAIMFTRRALLAVVLDDEAARVAGLPADALNAMLAALTAVTVVSAMRIVGVLLVAALMVLPVATSRLVARSFKATMLGAVAVGIVSAVLGLVASREWALASGGAIVLVAAGLFAVAAGFGSVTRIRERIGAESLLAGPH